MAKWATTITGLFVVKDDNMKSSELRVGDRIRIVDVPGRGIPNYTIHPETVRVYKMLVNRKRSVRICWIDEYGEPWYECRFRRRNGRLEFHSLVVMSEDTNWVPVKKRKR